jgi:transcriptional regulator with XRE-family HTH domain
MLDRLAALTPTGSDYAVRQLLDLGGRSTVSRYRKGEALPDVLTCYKIAELLGEDPQSVVIAIEMQRATSDEAKEFWLKRFRLAAATAAASIGVLVWSGNADIAELTNALSLAASLAISHTLYIMLTLRNRNELPCAPEGRS